MKSRWTWVPSLFAAEEIPSAVVIFVTLLMFLQMGSSSAEATFLTSLLTLPWIFKPSVQSWVNKIGHFKQILHVIELLLFMGLIAIAAAFSCGRGWIFISLFIVSMLCAWHELTARMYYEHVFSPRIQRLFNGLRMFSAQTALVMTYGALIIAVGALEIYFRQIRPAWSMGCYILAGIFLLFALYHMLILKDFPKGNQGTFKQRAKTLENDTIILERTNKQRGRWHPLLTLFLLLLPQSLMFHTRVLFLIDPKEAGGLGCTIQDIGFAQGTVGVIGFSLGITLGFRLMKKYNSERLLWQLAIMLGISPLVYVCMTYFPPNNLGMLCAATLTAQFFFGMGLNVCRIPVRQISGEQYRNSIDILSIPIISACMIIPMAISGLLSTQLGYKTYFMMDLMTAPGGWLGAYLLTSSHKED